MALADTWRWDEESFVVAWEAGVFRDQRVELVEGEVWPVSIGTWHGAVAGNVTRLLPNSDWRVTSTSLPAAGSVTDPDVWVHRRGARPVSHRGGVEVFSEPFEAGYRRRLPAPVTGTVPVPYRPDVFLAVADLLDAEE